MTKQEYEEKYDAIDGDYADDDSGSITMFATRAHAANLRIMVCQEYIASIEAEIQRLERENEKLNRMHCNVASYVELEACRDINEALRKENVQLRKDNQALVEQMNAVAGKLEKAIEILADDGAIACPAIKVGYKCNNGNGCNRLDSCLTGECWTEYFKKGDKS